MASEPRRPWAADLPLALLLALLLGAGPGQAAADLERCRSLRQQQDELAAAAMQAELVLVRQLREEICPQLSHQAEGANANERLYAPTDYDALLACRHRSEERLRHRHAVLYRNRLQFPFHTPAGAARARQADRLAQQRKQRDCPRVGA